MRYSWIFLLSLPIYLLASCSVSRQAGLPKITSESSLVMTSTASTSTQEPQVTPTTLTPFPTPTRTALPIERAESTLSSPDKKWAAYFFGYYRAQLKVANAEKTIIWEINEGNFGGTEALFAPYRWSQDGKYLYFNTHVTIDGYVPFYDGMGLRRLDVSTGKVSEIFPSRDVTNSRWNLVNFSLSPNDKQLAYISHIDRKAQLVIRDMETGKENSLLLKGYSNAGSIIWSPKQDRLVLALAKGNDWENTIYTVIEVDVTTLTLKVLIQDNKLGLDPIKWANNNEIVIQERGENQNILFVNLVTKEVRVAPTATPFPK